jgi:hypothetical protein
VQSVHLFVLMCLELEPEIPGLNPEIPLYNRHICSFFREGALFVNSSGQAEIDACCRDQGSLRRTH